MDDSDGGVFFVYRGGIDCDDDLELRRPTELARGFLPMATTRGDRFFISLLSAAFIHLVWLATGPGPVEVASVLSIIWAIALMRWG